MDEVVGNQILPTIQQLEERIETPQTTLFDPLPPQADAPPAILLRARCVEDGCQLLAQRIGLLQGPAMHQEAIQARLLLLVEIGLALAEGPDGAFEVVTRVFGQFL